MTGIDKRNRPCDMHTEVGRVPRKSNCQSIRAKNVIARAADAVASVFRAPALATAIA